jgi:hypothetical protein
MVHVERSGCHSMHCDGGHRRDRADDFRENILNKELDGLEGRIDRLKNSYARHKDDLSPRERREFDSKIDHLEHKASRLRHDINHGHLDRGEFREINRELDRFEGQISDVRQDMREEVHEHHCHQHHDHGRPDRDDGCGHGGPDGGRPDGGRPDYDWVPGHWDCGNWVPGHWERDRRDSGGDAVSVRDHRTHDHDDPRDHRTHRDHDHGSDRRREPSGHDRRR